MLHHDPQAIRSGDFFVVDGTGREQHVPSVAKAIKAPVGLWLVRGSQRLGMSTGMTTVSWWTAQDSNSNGDRCETVNFTPPEGILLLENMVYSAWFNKSEFIKENIDETIFMFALFKCRKSDKGRN